MGSVGSTIFRVVGLVDNSGIDHVAQERAVTQTLGWRLHHKHYKHPFSWIDPESRSASTTPMVVARRAVYRRDTRVKPHSKTKTKAISRPRSVIRPRHHATPKMVAGHVGNGFRPENSLGIERAAVQEHLQKAGVVDLGRHHATAARLPCSAE